MLPALEGGAAEIGGPGQHARAGRPGQQIKLLVARAPAQQAKAQRAGDDPIEELPAGTPQEPGQRLDQRLVIDQRVGEAIGRDGLAGLGKGQMLLRQDAFGPEDDFDIVEPFGKPQQHLDAARKRNGLEARISSEQIFPAGFVAAGQLGSEDGQRLRRGCQPGVGKEIVWDGLPPIPDCIVVPGKGFRHAPPCNPRTMPAGRFAAQVAASPNRRPHFGGEVLKFIGDGVLAIFPVAGTPAEACEAALHAVIAARAGMAHLDGMRQAQGLPPLPFGVELHLGEILWGNIGAADQLDFTAIGPAVNLVSRLEGLCRPLGRPVLISGAVAAETATPLIPLGEHILRGITVPCAVFTLPDA